MKHRRNSATLKQSTEQGGRLYLRRRDTIARFACHDARVRNRQVLAGVMCLVISVSLVACSSAGGSTSPSLPNRVTAADKAVPFKPCEPAVCEGEIDGYRYQIVMPEKWNGSLMLYSHGFRSTNPTPPAGEAAFDGTPEIAPGWSMGSKGVGEGLLAGGYALAGAAAKVGGWQVDQQVEASKLLRSHFAEKIGTPDRVYAWGDSVGAVASAKLAQTEDWVSGAAPLCGQLAGLNPNYDLILDAEAAVKAVLYPDMKLAGFTSIDEARSTYAGAMKAVRKAVKDNYGPGATKLAAIGIAAAIPRQSATEDGAGISGSAKAVTQALTVLLARGTVDRFSMEQQFGGNPSTNVGTNYTARVTQKDVDRVDVFEPGTLEKTIKLIDSSPRVQPVASAREAAAKSGALTGQIRVPTVSLHTEFDSQAIVQNDTVLVVQAANSGREQERLLKINVTSPPIFYSANKVTRYGAGHCNFTPESVIGTVVSLDDWVRNGAYPSLRSTEEALGSDSGFNPNYRLARWPGGSAIPGTVQGMASESAKVSPGTASVSPPDVSSSPVPELSSAPPPG